MNGRHGIERFAGGSQHRDVVIDLFAQQCLCHGRVDADPALLRIELVVADDANLKCFSLVVLQTHVGPKKDLVGIGGQSVHYLQLVEPLGEIADARNDPVEFLLVIGVKEPLFVHTI